MSHRLRAVAFDLDPPSTKRRAKTAGATRAARGSRLEQISSKKQPPERDNTKEV
jgi:hypothetical protein